MIDPKLLPLLRCPIDGEPLHPASAEIIQRLNETLQSTPNQVRDWLDQPVTAPLESGLINTSGERLYPVRAGIPTLISEQAIRLSSVPPSGS